MSSFNDTSGYTSRDDSFPIEESESELFEEEEEGDEEEESFYTGQGTQDEGSSLEDVARPRRRGDAYGGRLPRSRGVLSSSAATGLSSDFYSGQTSYLTPSDSMSQPALYEPEEYLSTGYGSLSYDYDDSAQRSRSELSSTLASFFVQNETVAWVREMGYFFRRPILFFLFTAGGNGALGQFFRAMQVWSPRGREGGEGLSPEALGCLPGVPQGYPDVPSWLREVRAGLPAVVERPVAWILHRRGVPILSELQQSSSRAASAIASKFHDSTVGWEMSGQMIPVGIFLPIFTYFALYIASHVVAKRAEHSRLLLLGDELSQVDPISVTESRFLSREYSGLAFSSTLDLSIGKGEEDDRRRSISTTPASVRQRQGSESVADLPDGAERKLLPKLEIPAKDAKPLGLPEAAMDENPDFHEESPATTRQRSLTRTPGAGQDESTQWTPSPGLAGATPLPVEGRTPLQPRDQQVFIALLGTPSATESNSVLVAALKHRVSAVLLPDTMVNEPRLIEVSEAELQIQFARDPLTLALNHARQHSLDVIAVFLTNEFAPDSISLFLFPHPARALYLFVPPSQEEALAPAMAQASTARIFVGTVRRTERGIPVSECLYDRLRKEQQ